MGKYVRYKEIYERLCNDVSEGGETVGNRLDVSFCTSSMNSYRGYLIHFRAFRQLDEICVSGARNTKFVS